jgi:hypothetical protein
MAMPKDFPDFAIELGCSFLLWAQQRQFLPDSPSKRLVLWG